MVIIVKALKNNLHRVFNILEDDIKTLLDRGGNQHGILR